ncbi:PREDICTED: coiled-coil domain-containing protein 105 [Nanorana parkeri]|uniref:coiled-coil domain-containing protein 105 n=1 Tax=Nanorana parkeri TaxID=125878 RepID=UPI000853F840|nr:PREDICTED: coiled-coil domain-containing protein 105 [Nanorana parkeri]
MAVPSVGSATWRDASYRTIRLAQGVRLYPFSSLPSTASSQEEIRPEGETTQRKGTSRPPPTPAPFHRDLIGNTCNAFACGYMRETRSSLYILRQALWETDCHIQKLQKQREILERSHANTRRDIVTNNETVQLRSRRPMTERYPDKVDPLIQEERSSLLDLKRYTELQLYEVSRLLKVLYSHRQRLYECCRQKGRVLDIISESGRPQSRGQKTPAGGSLLGAENKDSQSARYDALKTCERFRNIKPPNWNKLADCTELKDSVTQGLRQKAEETSRIRDDVTLALGDVKNMIQRQQRMYEELEGSYQLQLGPESSLDLTVRERLDRPLVRILQRHPGTQLPESTLICQGSASLEQALSKAQDRIGVLHMIQMKLREDQENKMWGERIDRAATRLRVKSAKGRGERLCL